MRFLVSVLSLSLGFLFNINSGISQKAENFDSSSFVYDAMNFRNIGPFRGGRSVAATGIPGNDQIYYMGSTGGGIWKTTDAGITWLNISDGQLNTGSVGSIAVANSDPNVIYVGMGEHPVRGVMTSHGDGVYKSTDAGKTWKNIGLKNSRHIAEIRIHPNNPDLVFVAVQGALHGDSEDRGVYRSKDGGANWQKILYVDATTGAADLSMDIHNPRILFASMWDHRRYPWQVRSGGKGSNIYKSTDGGDTWKILSKGLPKEMGKSSIDVSAANPEIVYANIESKGDLGGVYKSKDAGESWTQTTKDRLTVARAWYYIEIFADPKNENTVYVLNAPMLKSIDGGKTFENISNPHGDQHHLWINPANAENIILANDGGACITFNGGSSWSSQQNQPTIQFYRVITDNQFPYNVYGGQQDNSSIITTSRTLGAGIGWKDWRDGPGCESAFVAFDPNNPLQIFGGCYQGNISVLDMKTGQERDIMAYPTAGLAWTPANMKYRFNWNAPIVASIQDPTVIYHGANVVLKTSDGGTSWTEISPDLTRNDKLKQVDGGAPYTNEGAGGEVYNTLSYIELSSHDSGVIWTGSDCGLVHVTRNGGKDWINVTPKGLEECLINAIDVSPHDPSTAYIAATRYKFNDFKPMIFVTKDFGKSWNKMVNGIAGEDFIRVVREDLKVPGILYAGSETGLYLSLDSGKNWRKWKANFPTCPVTDITMQDNDLVVSTSGRSFWILDDLSAIQQSVGNFDQDLKVYTPKSSYRVPGSGRNRPGTVLGENPESGITIDYYLDKKIDSLSLQLQIYDFKGELIRSFSSEKDKEFKSFIGGPRAEPLLSAKKGLNRFSWDMRRSPIDGVHNIFILGSYDGAIVPPGTYRFVMTYGDHVSESNAVLLADPRMKLEQKLYEEQYNFLLTSEAMVKDVHTSVNAMREVKDQIKFLKKNYLAAEDLKELLSASDLLLTRIESWESKLIQEKQKTFQDVINFPNKLNAELINLMSRIASHDPRITQGVQDRIQDLRTEYNVMAAERGSIRTQINEFNSKFKESKTDILIFKE